jgi:hypothetical protein
MSYEIKQSSTQAPLLFFLTLASDHLSPATGKTPTVTISKAGAAFASPSGTVSEIANGWYKVAGNATDTNTLGPIALHATEASSDNCDLIIANVVKYDPQASDMGLAPPSEAYVAQGAVGTFSTILQALRSLGSSKWTAGSPSGAQGTLASLKVDGSTTAKTWVGNDPVNPSQLIETT